MMHLKLTKLLFITLSLLPALVLALPSDREQPINIEADHAQLDDERGVTQYKGNAILTQGTLRITGDIITFYYDDNQQITKAIAEGNLAKYQQIHKQGEEPVKARALQMEYHAKAQKIYLLGDGYVLKDGDKITGNRIEYDITKNIVHVNSGPVKIGDKVHDGDGGRISITILPPGSQKAKKPAKKENKTEKPAPVAEAPKAEQKSEIVETKAAEKHPTATTTTHLNLRTGPSTQYGKLGTFRPISEIFVLTNQKEWVQVRGTINAKPVIGWVSRRYIKLNN